MTTPAEIERMVRHLDHDVQAFYEMLAGISATQHRQGNRLTEMDSKLDTIVDLLRGDRSTDAQ